MSGSDPKPNPVSRNQQIFAAHQAGAGIRQIARNFGITRQAVSQICAKMADRREADEVRAHNVELLRRGADPLTIPIDGLNFSVRLRNTLCENEGLYSLGEVFTRNRAELLRTRNFGRKSLRELEEFLESVGLSFLGEKRKRYRGREHSSAQRSVAAPRR